MTTIEQIFKRACAALYICEQCGATILGRDIRMSRRGLAVCAPGVLPRFSCPRCEAAFLEPIEGGTMAP